MEKLHFKVESPANFVKLACTILFERKEELLDDYGSTWHDVFDGEAGNQHFQRFMEELFPDGCTIGERELNQLTDKAIQFLKTDAFCLDIKAGHDKSRSAFWVYFIPEHKVYPCQFAQLCVPLPPMLSLFGGRYITGQTDCAKPGNKHSKRPVGV